MKIIFDIVIDILQYLDPVQLNQLAESFKWWRWVVNKMDRAAYIERWLDSAIEKPYMNTRYVYAPFLCYLREELNNKWYFCLQFHSKPSIKVLLNILNKTDTKVNNKQTHLHMNIHKNIHYNNFINKRLFISMKCTNISNEDINILKGIHSIRLWDCRCLKDLSALCESYSIELRYDNIVNIIDLDVSSLGSVHSVGIVLYRHDIANISSLANVYSLKLSYFDNLWDVGSLGSIPDLNLTYCIKVIDVNELGGVSKLNLNLCMNIKDISGLGGVQKISAVGCNSITDISMIKATETLKYN